MTEVKKKRTLEDFFAAPPENYVIDPNREVVSPNIAPEKKAALVNELESERERNESMGALTTVSKKGNTMVVDSGEIDASGIIASPVKKPVAQELPEIPDAPVEKPSVTKSIRSAMGTEAPAPSPKREVAAETPAPQKDSSFPWDRALIGATPLLVGLLTGNKLEGLQVSSNHVVKDEGDLYKRQRDLDGKLAEMKAKREVEGVGGGKRRFSAQTIALKDGTNVKATFDTFTGRYLDPQGSEIPSNFIRAGYAVNPEEDDRRILNRHGLKKNYADYVGTNTRLDPTTGELGIVRDGQIGRIGGQETGSLNVKQQQEAKELRAEFRQNPIVKRTLPVLSGANQVMRLLNSGKAVSQKAAQTILARMSGEVGNLSEMEQAVYTRSPSINSKVKGWLNLQATDEALQPHEVGDLKQIATFYAEASREMMEGAIQETQSIGRDDYDLPDDTVNRITSPIAAPLMEQSRKGAIAGKPPVIEYRGRKWSSPNPAKSMPFTIPGDDTVYWEPPSMWEKIKSETPGAKRLK